MKKPSNPHLFPMISPYFYDIPEIFPLFSTHFPWISHDLPEKPPVQGLRHAALQAAAHARGRRDAGGSGQKDAAAPGHLAAGTT